jgi:hypothetical protein
MSKYLHRHRPRIKSATPTYSESSDRCRQLNNNSTCTIYLQQLLPFHPPHLNKKKLTDKKFPLTQEFLMNFQYFLEAKMSVCIQTFLHILKISLTTKTVVNNTLEFNGLPILNAPNTGSRSLLTFRCVRKEKLKNL